MKNKFKLLGLSLAGLMALTACSTSEIQAKPTDYNEALITIPSGQQELYNNVKSVVYDAIHTNGVGSDVLEEILYLYAIEAFGAYNKQVKVNDYDGNEHITLQEAVTSNNTTTMSAFVRQHKAYWDEGRTSESVEPASESERLRVVARYAAINSRFAKKMYEKISDGAYTDRHIFSEAKLLKTLRSQMESVADPSLVGIELYEGIIKQEVEPEDVFSYYLHLEHYMSDANTYIIDEIMPEVYKDLLSELYLLEETYNSLGRSYARKVNIIEFANNSAYPDAAYYLANQLVSEINAAPTDFDITNMLERFQEYSRAYVGVFEEGSVEENILTEAGVFTKKDYSATIPELLPYYLGTEYGDTGSSYYKLMTASKNDSTLNSKFTGNNSYPTYVGLNIQRLEAEEKDHTTTGWFIKNGGLTSLPSDIRSRLFNIGVANGVKETSDDKEAASRKYVNGEWQEATDENAYVCRINGHNFLKKAERVKGDSIEKDILHYDASSKTYYIIEIEEAVSSSKMSPTSANYYGVTRGKDVVEDIINAIAKIVSDAESYGTLATKKYLKEMAIEYHDESVYNYFKTNYPELFE